MELDFEKSRDAVECIARYLENSLSPQQLAIAMQADVTSRFHHFDLIAHATYLQNAVDQLLEAAMSTFDQGASDDA